MKIECDIDIKQLELIPIIESLVSKVDTKLKLDISSKEIRIHRSSHDNHYLYVDFKNLKAIVGGYSETMIKIIKILENKFQVEYNIYFRNNPFYVPILPF